MGAITAADSNWQNTFQGMKKILGKDRPCTKLGSRSGQIKSPNEIVTDVSCGTFLWAALDVEFDCDNHFQIWHGEWLTSGRIRSNFKFSISPQKHAHLAKSCLRIRKNVIYIDVRQLIVTRTAFKKLRHQIYLAFRYRTAQYNDIA